MTFPLANSLVNSTVGETVFEENFFGASEERPPLEDASIVFCSSGLSGTPDNMCPTFPIGICASSTSGAPIGRILIKALATGQYAGEKGNGISALIYRLSANRFALQMFDNTGAQMGTNITTTGGLSALVDLFNGKADFVDDFIAYALTADVDGHFQTGVNYGNSMLLSGGGG